MADHARELSNGIGHGRSYNLRESCQIPFETKHFQCKSCLGVPDRLLPFLMCFNVSMCCFIYVHAVHHVHLIYALCFLHVNHFFCHGHCHHHHHYHHHHHHHNHLLPTCAQQLYAFVVLKLMAQWVWAKEVRLNMDSSIHGVCQGIPSFNMAVIKSSRTSLFTKFRQSPHSQGHSSELLFLRLAFMMGFIIWEGMRTASDMKCWMVQHQSEVFSHAEFKDVHSEAIMRLAGESVELWFLDCTNDAIREEIEM